MFLWPKAKTSQHCLYLLTLVSRSLSNSFLYIGDLAVTIHLAGGQYWNWTELNSYFRYSINFIFLETRLLQPSYQLQVELIVVLTQAIEETLGPHLIHYPGKVLLFLCQTVCFLDSTWPFGVVLQYFPGEGYRRGNWFSALHVENILILSTNLVVWPTYRIVHWKWFFLRILKALLYFLLLAQHC